MSRNVVEIQTVKTATTLSEHSYFILLFLLIQYLSRGIQFSRASLNGALILRPFQLRKK